MWKQSFVILLTVLIVAFCFALTTEATVIQSKDKGSITEEQFEYRIRSTRDYVFKQNGLSGIADKNGNVLVEAKYTFIDNALEDQRISVVLGNKSVI